MHYSVEVKLRKLRLKTGQSSLEYVLILAFVTLVAIGFIQALSNTAIFRNLFQAQQSDIPAVAANILQP